MNNPSLQRGSEPGRTGSSRAGSARLLLWLLVGLLPLAAVSADRAPVVRPPAVAGSWYPGERDALASLVDGLLERANPDPAATQGPPVRALILPHAGYVYSGATAAVGYKLVVGAKYRRVLVLGPAHRGGFRGLSIARVDAYETPLGRIPVDAVAVKQLRASPLVTSDPLAHRQEHSIEMQLPLLQRSLAPGWKLLPILVGWLEPGDPARAARLLRPLLDDLALLLVSTDFTHYGASYHYLPFALDAHTPQRIEALDQGALQAILQHNAQAFLDYQARTGITICGYQALAILLDLLPQEAQGRLLAHTTSGALTGNYRQSVSYYAIAFRSPTPLNAGGALKNPTSGPAGNRDSGMHRNDEGHHLPSTQAPDPPADPPAERLSESEWRLLHRIALLGMRDAAADKPNDPGANEAYLRLEKRLPQRLKRPAGVFVTLWEGERLRGCVGYIPPIRPLGRAVYENAWNAARDDPRFLPVTGSELPHLKMEISVLSPLRPITSPEAFQVGKQGIVLDKDGRRAVYLPEVASRFGWNREQTLDQLALKAGLARDAWKAEDVRLSVFTSQEHRFPSLDE